MIVPVRTYLAVFVALMTLTAITVAAAHVDLGALNVATALAIATVKGSLVVLYFMHVRFGSALVRIFAVAGFYWLGILIALTLGDYLTRL